jgi:hypothetical protein
MKVHGKMMYVQLGRHQVTALQQAQVLQEQEAE